MRFTKIKIHFRTSLREEIKNALPAGNASFMCMDSFVDTLNCRKRKWCICLPRRQRGDGDDVNN